MVQRAQERLINEIGRALADSRLPFSRPNAAAASRRQGKSPWMRTVAPTLAILSQVFIRVSFIHLATIQQTDRRQIKMAAAPRFDRRATASTADIQLHFRQ
jgi:hypothetical protein